MNKKDLNDELQPEYDLTSLQVRKVGAGRKILQDNMIQLDIDVARVFPDSAAVNEALRFLVRITQQHKSELAHK